MLWRDAVDLLVIGPDGSEAPRPVFANKKDVRQTEFYQAAAAGLKPDIMFEIRCAEYNDEMAFRHNGKLYYILRTYSKDSELYEVVAGQMVLPHQVTLVKCDPTRIDRQGRHPVISESERACRIEESNKVTKDRNGSEVVSKTQFTFPGWYKVAYWDRIRWTDAAGMEQNKSPLSMDIIRDKLGNEQFLVVNC